MQKYQNKPKQQIMNGIYILYFYSKAKQLSEKHYLCKLKYNYGTKGDFIKRESTDRFKGTETIPSDIA